MIFNKISLFTLKIIREPQIWNTQLPINQVVHVFAIRLQRVTYTRVGSIVDIFWTRTSTLEVHESKNFCETLLGMQWSQPTSLWSYWNNMAAAYNMETARLNAARMIKEINFTLDCIDHGDRSQNMWHQNSPGHNNVIWAYKRGFQLHCTGRCPRGSTETNSHHRFNKHVLTALH